MKAARALISAFVLLAAGCPLSSFDKVSARDEGQGGGAGSGGVENDAAPEAEGGSAGADPDGGDAGAEIEAVDDEYVLRQGETLARASAGGVLANDRGSGVTVVEQSDANPGLPAAFEATYEIFEGGDFTFTPAPDFFGVYRVSYTIEDEGGRRATATVRFVVQPRDVGLDAVAQGVGGLVVSTPANEGLGSSIAGAGDVNGDGFDDLVIGASDANSGAGRIYVVYGRASTAAIDIGPSPSSNETEYFTLDGASGDTAGVSVSGAGDLNDDSFADLLIGANQGGVTAGKVYVVYGGVLRGSLALDALPASRGYLIEGQTPDQFANLGQMVRGGGDLNGDEKPDLLLGTAGPATNRGRVTVLFGDPGDNLGGAGSIDLASYTPKVTLDGYPSSNDDLPRAMAFAGDVDGDGQGDLIVSSARRIALVYGRTDTAFPANIDLVDEPNAGWGLERTRPSQVGIAAVSGAGFVNDDTLADVAVCDRTSASGPAECVVSFGPPSSLESGWRFRGFAGLPMLPPSCLDATGDGLSDLSFVDGSTAYVVFGKDADHADVAVNTLGNGGFRVNAEAGGTIGAVTAVGDFNGDGFGDYAFADPSAAGGRGKVYVLFGGDYVPR